MNGAGDVKFEKVFQQFLQVNHHVLKFNGDIVSLEFISIAYHGNISSSPLVFFPNNQNFTHWLFSNTTSFH